MCAYTTPAEKQRQPSARSVSILAFSSPASPALPQFGLDSSRLSGRAVGRGMGLNPLTGLTGRAKRVRRDVMSSVKASGHCSRLGRPVKESG